MEDYPNPYECQYCHGPKTFKARWCIKCQAVAIDIYRRNRSRVILGAYKHHVAAFGKTESADGRDG